MDNKVTIIIEILFAVFFSFCSGIFLKDRKYSEALAEIGFAIVEIVCIILSLYS